MFNHEFMPFQTVTIRPHWGQFCINELPVILLCLASYWISSFMEFRFHELITLHGVLSHSTDYIELYRVVDYRQHQSLPQQLFGLKTITIYSGDRNNPQLDMVGIKARVDIVSEIRKRVEFNKKRKGIYEITNRP